MNDKNTLKTILEAIDSLNNCAQACGSYFSIVYNFTQSLWLKSGGEVPNFFIKIPCIFQDTYTCRW